jgi:hypothetical protein
LEDRKCFYWWVQKHFNPFAVQSASKSQITLNEEVSLWELHLPSLCAYSLVWMQNIAHWKPGVVIPGFCFAIFIKRHKLSQVLARASNDQCIHFMSTKKLIEFDPRSIEEHTGCTPWMLSTL